MEVVIAGEECGVELGSEGGGEGIGVTEAVAHLEPGGMEGTGMSDWKHLDRGASELRDHSRGSARAHAPLDVVQDLTKVDERHQHGATLAFGYPQHGPDSRPGWFGKQHPHERKRIEREELWANGTTGYRRPHRLAALRPSNIASNT